MNICLECRKIKRTGLIPAFLGGGIVAALVPLLNMSFRSEMYVSRNAPALQILLDANWQMMAMLNLLLVVSGACVLYLIEYRDNAICRMSALPFNKSRLFLGKCLILTVMAAMMLLPEMLSLAFCCRHWFSSAGIPESAFYIGLFANYGYFLLLMLPAVLASLLIASACRNMWISLGINIVCIFMATMLPHDNFVLSLFPFALPFQTMAGADTRRVISFVIGAFIEIVIIGIAELIDLKIRRCFE